MRVGMSHPAARLPLHAEDGSTLEMWARSATAPHRVVSQAKALLMAGDGVADSRIATALGISRPTVLDWRARFRAEGLDSVGAVRPGRGRRPEITADQVQGIVHSTLHETRGATHWSCRSMAKAAGVSRSTVQPIWDAHGLQRAGTRGFGGFPDKLARTSPRCGGDRVGDHKPSLIRSRVSWPQFLPRQAAPSLRTVSKDLWARSLCPRVRQLRQASLQRA